MATRGGATFSGRPHLTRRTTAMNTDASMLGTRFSRLVVLWRLVGLRIAALFIIAIPFGVFLGIVEIITASLLYAVLAEFHLVAASRVPVSLTFGLDPITALVLFTIIAALTRYGGQLLPAIGNIELNARLRSALVRNVFGGVTERSIMPVADASHLLQSVIPRSGDFMQSVAGIAVGLCMLLLILGGMIHLSWPLTVAALVFTALLGLLLTFLRRVYGRNIEALYSLMRVFNTSFIKNARNGHLLRVCGANEAEVHRLDQIWREYVGASKRYHFVLAISQNVPQIASVFVVVGILWLNARMTLVPAETLVPLVYLLARIAGSIGNLAGAAGQFQENRPYVAELHKYASQLFPSSEPQQIGSDAPARLFPLVVNDLRFGRDTVLVPPVSLSARGGDMVVISGASGRGKTTFIMTLIGFLNPLGGSISWGEMPIEMIDPAHLRRRLGYAGPEPYLLDADIRSNLLFGLEGQNNVSDADIKKALHLACADFVFDLEGGLSHRLREAGDGISAGQKQRLSLARCLLRRPEILLLDEATANIDEDIEEQIIERVKNSFPNTLLIAVSHRASLRRHATVRVEL